MMRAFWIALGCFVWTVPVAADDWPVFQQNVQRNAKVAERLRPESLAVRWQRDLPGPPNPAWSGPAKWDAYAGIRGLKSMRDYDPVFHVIAVGESLWLASSVDDAVHCLGRDDGETRWVFHTDGPLRIAPTYHEGRLYFGSDDGYAYCIDAESAESIWRFSPKVAERRIVNNGRLISQWPIRTGVLVADGKAYFAGSLLPWQESYLCAVDATTGRADGVGNYVRRIDKATMEGPLSLVPGRFLVSPQGRVAPRLFALDDGKPMGSLQGGGGSFVVLTKDSVFHGPGNKTGWLTASSLDSLEKVASFKSGNAMVVAGDVSFILMDEVLTASNYVGKHELWSVPCDCPLAMVLAGDTLFVGGRGVVRGFDAQSGALRWSHAVLGSAYGLAVAQGQLYVSTDTGRLYAFAEASVPVASPVAAPGSFEDLDSSEDLAEDLAPVERDADADLLDRWVFQRPYVAGRRVENLAKGNAVESVNGAIQLARVGRMQAIRFDDRASILRASDDLARVNLPTTEMTATAWVRVDEAAQWGGLVGCLQDNGDYERGWLLGFEGTKFSFALCGAGDAGNGLTYLAASRPFRLGSWHHVASTYDGTTMRLYLDGQEVGVSQAESGPISYPPRGIYVVGAYKDDNEEYRLTGQLHEVRVYRRALSAAEVQTQSQSLASGFPAAAEEDKPAGTRLAQGPLLRFTQPGTAEVQYRTDADSSTELTLRLQGQVVQRVVTDPGQSHRVTLKDLKHNELYTYQIRHQRGEATRWTDEYECDTFFDYSIAPSGAGDRDPSAPGSQAAQRIAEAAGRQRGLCLVLGCDEGQLITNLVGQTEWRVIAFDDDARRVDQLRVELQSQGIYGTRVTVHYVESLQKIPITSRVANVIVCESLLGPHPKAPSTQEIKRLLSPRGVAILGHPARLAVPLPGEFLAAARPLAKDGQWYQLAGTPLEGSGEWSHIYGSSANNHFGGEDLAAARKADDLVVQWLGQPGARYQADRNGRKPPPLSTGGRIYLQGLHRLLALDQYNGTILWAVELPEMDRYNMPRDCGNWCADEDSIFVTIHGQCWKLAAETGQVREVIEVATPDSTDVAYDWGYVAREHDLLLGSAVRQGTAWTSFWGKDSWYDASEGPLTDKVCSDLLSAREVDGSAVRWEYRRGAIVNSTITVGDGTVYFVETRGEHLQDSTRRLGGDAFWQNLYLVALDAQTGRLCWEQPLEIEAGTAAFYASFGEGRLVLVSSGKRTFYIYAFQGKTGDRLWDNQLTWGKGKADHGSHLSRPAIVGNRLYVRPGVFDLATGTQLPLSIPVGGCGTYAATSHALFFRDGSGRNSAVWDLQQGEYTLWDRLRPDCWLSTIPAGGMLLSPEGGGGCSCGSWLETSLGFIPRAVLDVAAP